ncbi:MAG TPA: heme o synthase [Kofleriaceae bacterium]|nr:heme o synthase [Kofleriaceae bacterium]
MIDHPVAKPVQTDPPVWADMVSLSKPRITLLNMITAAGGMVLAPGTPSLAAMVAMLCGTGLMVGAANALNMYLERDIDRRMARTKKRPLPTGRLSPRAALLVGVGQAVIATPLLSFALNPLTGVIGVLALVAYVMVYTPLKQRTSHATFIGAFPGAAPALIGWTAQTGSIGIGGLVVFAVIVIWQMPHFHAIALFRKKDYVRAGLKVLPDRVGDAATRRVIVCYLGGQLLLSVALYPLGVAGMWYLVTAALLGVAYFGYGLRGLSAAAGPRWARRLFLGSLVYLPVLFAVLVADGLL